RGLACAGLRLPCCPVLVLPLTLRQAVDDGCVRRPALSGEGDRVGFERQQIPVRPLDLELVHCSRGEAGYEQLPGPAFGPPPHGMAPAVPTVEAAHPADASGIRCPHCKADAGNTVDLARMCP